MAGVTIDGDNIVPTSTRSGGRNRDQQSALVLDAAVVASAPDAAVSKQAQPLQPGGGERYVNGEVAEQADAGSPEPEPDGSRAAPAKSRRTQPQRASAASAVPQLWLEGSSWGRRKIPGTVAVPGNSKETRKPGGRDSRKAPINRKAQSSDTSDSSPESDTSSKGPKPKRGRLAAPDKRRPLKAKRQCSEDLDDLESSSSEPSQVAEPVDHNETECRACRKSDRPDKLLCCETCPAVYHLYCLDPPLSRVPAGDWYCPNCSSRLALHNVERILDSRVAPGKEGGGRGGLEYYIKWRDRSYRHCQWISEADMLAAGKLDDELRKTLNRRVQQFNNPRAATRPSGGSLALDADGTAEIVNGVNQLWLQVHRVIAQRDSRSAPGHVEYLVKWKDLDYDMATWELDDALADDGAEVARFKAIRPITLDAAEREAAAEKERVKAKSKAKGKAKGKGKGEAKSAKGKGKGGGAASAPEDSPSKLMVGQGRRKFTETPDFLKGGELHPYQLEGLNWLYHKWNGKKNVILADEMGLGKTVQTIALLAALHSDFVARPHLVVVPLSTMANWERELATWAPYLNVVTLIGNADSRAAIVTHEMYAEGKKTQERVKFHVLLVSYEMASRELSTLNKLQWEVMVVDEAHRLRNRKSRLFQDLCVLRVDHVLLLTGTPLQNNLDELFMLMHFIDKKEFDSLEDFQTKFSSLSDQEQVTELHKSLAPHLLRRLKKDVLKQLPPKKEQIVRVELSALQKELYKSLLARHLPSFMAKGADKSTQLRNLVMQLRKCCNHPYLFEGSEAAGAATGAADPLDALVGASGKLELLDRMMPKLRAGGHRVLIYSQFTRVLDILEDWLAGRNWGYCRIDGSVAGTERQKRIDRFNRQPDEYFVFLLSTRAGGMGINLATADTVVLYDSDWNPHNDLQAQARAHRLGQLKPVMIYRLISRATVEERMIERAKGKMILEHVVVRKINDLKQQDLDDILRYGTLELFADEVKAEERKDSDGAVKDKEGSAEKEEKKDGAGEKEKEKDGAAEKEEKAGAGEKAKAAGEAKDEDKDKAEEGATSTGDDTKKGGAEGKSVAGEQDEKAGKGKEEDGKDAAGGAAAVAAARAKGVIVWDDLGLEKLLDRTELLSMPPEVEGEDRGTDLMKAFKVADFEMREEAEEEEVEEEEQPAEVAGPSTSQPEGGTQFWENLLKDRYASLSWREEAAVGRGKRERKAVQYNDMEDAGAMGGSASDTSAGGGASSGSEGAGLHARKRRKAALAATAAMAAAQAQPAAVQRRSADPSQPPLVSGSGARMLVLGLNDAERTRVLEALMRFGVEQDDPAVAVRAALPNKPPPVLQAYLELLIRSLTDSSSSDQAVPGVPRRALLKSHTPVAVLQRLGAMMLLRRKVKDMDAALSAAAASASKTSALAPAATAAHNSSGADATPAAAAAATGDEGASTAEAPVQEGAAPSGSAAAVVPHVAAPVAAAGASPQPGAAAVGGTHTSANSFGRADGADGKALDGSAVQLQDLSGLLRYAQLKYWGSAQDVALVRALVRHGWGAWREMLAGPAGAALRGPLRKELGIAQDYDTGISGSLLTNQDTYRSMALLAQRAAASSSGPAAAALAPVTLAVPPLAAGAAKTTTAAAPPLVVGAATTTAATPPLASVAATTTVAMLPTARSGTSRAAPQSGASASQPAAGMLPGPTASSEGLGGTAQMVPQAGSAAVVEPNAGDAAAGPADGAKASASADAVVLNVGVVVDDAGGAASNATAKEATVASGALLAGASIAAVNGVEAIAAAGEKSGVERGGEGNGQQPADLSKAGPAVSAAAPAPSEAVIAEETLVDASVRKSVDAEEAAAAVSALVAAAVAAVTAAAAAAEEAEAARMRQEAEVEAVRCWRRERDWLSMRAAAVTQALQYEYHHLSSVVRPPPAQQHQLLQRAPVVAHPSRPTAPQHVPQARAPQAPKPLTRPSSVAASAAVSAPMAARESAPIGVNVSRMHIAAVDTAQHVAKLRMLNLYNELCGTVRATRMETAMNAHRAQESIKLGTGVQVMAEAAKQFRNKLQVLQTLSAQMQQLLPQTHPNRPAFAHPPSAPNGMSAPAMQWGIMQLPQVIGGSTQAMQHMRPALWQNMPQSISAMTGAAVSVPQRLGQPLGPAGVMLQGAGCSTLTSMQLLANARAMSGMAPLQQQQQRQQQARQPQPEVIEID